MKQEKRVTIQTYQPTAASLLAVLKEHDESTDTDLREWTVEVEKVALPPSNVFPAATHRWEITLTRSIK
jgi:hypothetical protein